MSIDGIGKGPPAVPDAGGTGPTHKVGQTFRVETAGRPEEVGRAESAQRAEGASTESLESGQRVAGNQPLAHDALEQLQRGELSLDAFLDIKVDAAVQHLQLPTEQLDFVKTELREQLRTDPVLLELVRRTAGQVPSLDAG